MRIVRTKARSFLYEFRGQRYSPIRLLIELTHEVRQMAASRPPERSLLMEMELKREQSIWKLACAFAEDTKDLMRLSQLPGSNTAITEGKGPAHKELTAHRRRLFDELYVPYGRGAFGAGRGTQNGVRSKRAGSAMPIVLP